MKTEVYEVTVGCAGDIYWRQDGSLHRANGPAIEWSDGAKSWMQNGQHHRTNGPAVEHLDGSKFWYQNGKLHRTDGPAIERADGTKAWYIEYVEYTEREFNKKINPPTCDGKTVEIDGVKYKLSIV